MIGLKSFLSAFIFINDDSLLPSFPSNVSVLPVVKGSLGILITPPTFQSNSLSRNTCTFLFVDVRTPASVSYVTRRGNRTWLSGPMFDRSKIFIYRKENKRIHDNKSIIILGV